VTLIEALPGIVNVSRPADDARAAAAVALTQIATSFCLYHELAHIELGHVVSSQALFDSDEHLEFFGWRGWPWTKRRIARVWEYEADKIAAMMVAADMFDSDNVAVLSETFQIEESPIAMNGIALSAIYGVFFLFGQRADQEPKRSSHPHPMVRFGSVVEVLCNDVPKHANQDAGEIRETAIDILFSTHDAWRDLGLPIRIEVTDEAAWQSIFRGVDDLERDRLALLHHYRDSAWLYPFEKT
jgi:hypothetical protein